MTQIQKGLLATVVVVAAAIGVAYVGVRYLEDSVVESVNNWIADAPADLKLKVSRVSYNLQENMLTLNNVSFSAKMNDTTGEVNIEAIEVRKLDSHLLSLAQKPDVEIAEADFPVAETILLRRIVMSAPKSEQMPAMRASVASFQINNLRMHTAKARDIVQGKLQLDALLLPYLLAYSSSDVQSTSLTLENVSGGSTPETIRIGIDGMLSEGFAFGHTDSSTLQNIRVASNNTEVLAISKVRMENLNTPPEPLLRELNALKADAPYDQSMALLGKLFAGDEPLCGLYSVQGITITNPGSKPFTMDEFRFAQPQTNPLAFDVQLNKMNIPMELMDDFPMIKMLGLEKFDTSVTFSWASAAKKDDPFKSTASLAVAGLGTMDFACDGTAAPLALPKELPTSPENEKAFENFLSNYLTNDVKFSLFEMGYADEGLMPRLARIGQLMGLNLEAIHGIALSTSKEFAAEFPFVPGLEGKLTQFIDHPGALRISFKVPNPMSLNELEKANVNPEQAIDINVTPGPKTLQELVSALK